MKPLLLLPIAGLIAVGCYQRDQIRGEFEQIVLRDPNSDAAINLSCAEGIPSIALVDSSGVSRIGMNITADGPALIVLHTNGSTRLLIGQLDDNPFISINHPDGRSGILAEVSSTNQHIQFRDESDNMRAILASEDDKTFFIVMDGDRSRGASLRVAESAEMTLTVGESTKMITVETEGEE